MMSHISETVKIITKCAWCDTFLGFKSRVQALIGEPYITSHGICWDCQKKQLALLSKKARMRHEIKDQTQTEVQIKETAW